MKKLFEKYMRVKDPNKAHAVLSASGSERWMGCPGSIRMSDGIVSIDTDYGIAGTNTHTLIQFILENRDWETLLNHKDAKKFREHIDYNEEKLHSAMVAVSYVKSEMWKMKNFYGKAPQLLVEKKVELSGVGFGTADIILYQPFGVLHVMDYKNGRAVVEAEENMQGLYYAHATADLYGWDFSELWITIIQPNASHKRGPIRTWKTTPDRLEKAGLQFLMGVARTKMKNAPLVSNSKWCWFCPARAKCPEQMKIKAKNIMGRFERGPLYGEKKKEIQNQTR